MAFAGVRIASIVMRNSRAGEITVVQGPDPTTGERSDKGGNYGFKSRFGAVFLQAA
jgi:hypothetical protein